MAGHRGRCVTAPPVLRARRFRVMACERGAFVAGGADALHYREQGHTGDPVKDLEAKLKFIQDNVPTRIQNVSGRHAHARSATHTARLRSSLPQERPLSLPRCVAHPDSVLAGSRTRRAPQPSRRGVGRVPPVPDGERGPLSALPGLYSPLTRHCGRHGEESSFAWSAWTRRRRGRLRSGSLRCAPPACTALPAPTDTTDALCSRRRSSGSGSSGARSGR